MKLRPILNNLSISILCGTISNYTSHLLLYFSLLASFLSLKLRTKTSKLRSIVVGGPHSLLLKVLIITLGYCDHDRLIVGLTIMINQSTIMIMENDHDHDLGP